jgi:hypothetical protein
MMQLQQRYTTGEMGFSDHVAWQQCWRTNVRYGSDSTEAKPLVHPVMSGMPLTATELFRLRETTFWAIFCLTHCSKQPGFSPSYHREGGHRPADRGVLSFALIQCE